METKAVQQKDGNHEEVKTILKHKTKLQKYTKTQKKEK